MVELNETLLERFSDVKRRLWQSKKIGRPAREHKNGRLIQAGWEESKDKVAEPNVCLHRAFEAKE